MNETPDRLPLPIAQSSQDPDEVARELFKETGGGSPPQTPHWEPPGSGIPHFKMSTPIEPPSTRLR